MLPPKTPPHSTFKDILKSKVKAQFPLGYKILYCDLVFHVFDYDFMFTGETHIIFAYNLNGKFQKEVMSLQQAQSMVDSLQYLKVQKES